MSEPASTPFAAQPAAVAFPPEHPQAGVIAHYGDPLGEQRRLARGEAIADLGDRAVIAVTGPDRLGWLDSITSQALGSLTAGESRELLVLDPNGRVEHAAGVLDDGETAWLIADAADAPPLAAWLSRMVFRSRVTVEAKPELHVIGATAGGGAERALDEAAAVGGGIRLIWRDPWVQVAPGGHQYAQLASHPGAERAWIEAIVDGEARARLAAGETDAAGALAAEALRVAAWRPRVQAEVDERTIPHELDWLRSAVHLNKGCYRGQETVAKVHNLGHPPRRLVLLQLDGVEAAPGATVRTVDGAEVGVVTSAARHFEQGPIALAVIKRTTPVDAPLVVDVSGGEVAALQEVIVPPGAGAEASVPRLPRLSARR